MSRPDMDLTAMEFLELIEGFKRLKASSFEHQFDYDPFWIRAALIAHAKHSLNTLILRTRARNTEPIESCRSLEVLKKLALNYSYWVDNRGPRRTRLAGALPSSLEELRLHGMARHKSPAQRLNPLWAGQEILEDKETRLPRLKVFVFCDDSSHVGFTFLSPGYDRTVPSIADLQAACNAEWFWLDMQDVSDSSSSDERDYISPWERF